MNEIDFARFLLASGAIRFGKFKLKSGILSDTFYDFGNICRGEHFYRLGLFYASFIVDNDLYHVDAIFGPAYKGISIALSTSLALAQEHHLDIPFLYNRKTAKTHGEEGQLIGYPIEKVHSVLVVDDVITDGGTKYETIDLISRYPHVLIRAMVVGVDREACDNEGTPYKLIFQHKTGINLHAMTTTTTVKSLTP